MALIVNDRYAGDEAWQEWFEICSVAGCGAEFIRLAESAEVYSASNHP